MRKELMAATALSSATFALWSGQVVAQPIFEWAGPYVGGSVGVAVSPGGATFNFPSGTSAGNSVYFFGNVPYFSGINSTPTTPAYAEWPTSADFGGGGGVFTGTFDAGYNHQLGGLVIGNRG